MLIIGHAYGSHHGRLKKSRRNRPLGRKPDNKINKTSKLLYYRDVFSVPSEKKQALRRLTQPILVYTFRNHDVEITSDNAFHILRQRQSNQSKTYPQSFTNGSTLFILDDSTLGDSGERLLHFILNEVERNPLFSKLSWQDIIFLQEV